MMLASADVDALDKEIAYLFAEVHAHTARALSRVVAFDECEGWGVHGYQSCSHWMNFRLGVSLNTAREYLRVGHSLKQLPLISAAFAAGTMSYSKVRALTRIATPRNEEELVRLSLFSTAAQVERMVKACRRVGTVEAAQQMKDRSVSVQSSADGMYTFSAKLMPDEGARLHRLLQSLIVIDPARSAESLRADALIAICDLAMTAQAGGAVEAGHRCGATELVVHVDAEVLGGSEKTQGDVSAETFARSQVEGANGELVSVSRETVRRLSCDAGLVVMAHDDKGNVLDVGRRSRRLNAPLKRAVLERDRGCRYPGCPNRMVDVHHLKHWCEGGETKAANLLSLCRYHHTLVHEGGVRLDEKVGFVDAAGEPLDVPSPHAPVETRSLEGLTPSDGPYEYWYDWRADNVVRAVMMHGDVRGDDE